MCGSERLETKPRHETEDETPAAYCSLANGRLPVVRFAVSNDGKICLARISMADLKTAQTDELPVRLLLLKRRGCTVSRIIHMAETCLPSFRVLLKYDSIHRGPFKGRMRLFWRDKNAGQHRETMKFGCRMS